MSKISVIDSIMGSGKTSWAIEYMNENKIDKQFIYVTPFLDEVERVRHALPHMHEPNEKKGGKLRHFKQLLASGVDIVTTHALFSRFDTDIYEMLAQSGYTLILDEVFNVIEQLNISNSDIKNLIETGTMKIENHKVIWLDNQYDGAFNELKDLAEQGNAYSHNGNIIFWTFPASMFQVFEEVYVLTYLFNGQIQRYYYDYHGVQYDFKAVERQGNSFVLVDYDKSKENRQQYADLINIYEGNGGKTDLNVNYLPELKPLKNQNELSSTWFKFAGEEVIARLKKNIYTYFRNVAKAKANDIMWTTIKSKQDALKGKGYTKGFVSLTMRATNKYSHTHNLAYVYNKYMNPYERQFFTSAGVTVDDELLAVSDLIQWIWRSGIRNNPAETINIYIPSKRMRDLLKQWIKGEI